MTRLAADLTPGFTKGASALRRRILGSGPAKSAAHGGGGAEALGTAPVAAHASGRRIPSADLEGGGLARPAGGRAAAGLGGFGFGSDAARGLGGFGGAGRVEAAEEEPELLLPELPELGGRRQRRFALLPSAEHAWFDRWGAPSSATGLERVHR